MRETQTFLDVVLQNWPVSIFFPAVAILLAVLILTVRHVDRRESPPMPQGDEPAVQLPARQR